ncbi:hypothetical protein [Kitasatospora terrestris]|uniref:Uncharacterized protein n=1 Tax=Kitasatospora terrestris TaxID=258051 RepID=A0ABP9DCU0_9ACTN
MEDFFKAGKVYRHLAGGAPTGLGIFVVVYVGRAPGGFSSPAEPGEVAFGWRRGRWSNGTDGPMGAYTSADFSGWVELDDSDLLDALRADTG